MTRLLHLDASPRPGRAGTHEHGSLSRRLSHHFIEQWKAARPEDPVTRRDLGARPPSLLTVDWIEAAFTPSGQRSAALQQALAESDVLVDEVIAADVLVLGVPLYNYSYPAAFKAWIDQIVRVERTLSLDPSNLEHPVGPLLNDRPRHAVILSSRGGHGLGAGGPLAHMNHLEASVRTALELIGIEHFHEVAIEYQEEGGERLQRSIRDALVEVERLVVRLQAARDEFNQGHYHQGHARIASGVHPR
ncbi:FMN-dependent NADH-azoreductase [Alloalcanivorax marinus]|uniref:FMN-dependent NADH-azoreductase n=1 Tax=Alloalcanivorax marinus TaxID=1177169 RepID=UPI0021D2149A|nr:NAD(P)H-dependent oxidoreductase [Alloalcanivorax marinus]MCU5786660.1 NAD(P)H dehydrogenase (quinone) [Alloalcanivorax marinus]